MIGALGPAGSGTATINFVARPTRGLGPTGCAGISLPFSVPVPLAGALVGPVVLGGGAFGSPPSSFSVAGARRGVLGFPISLSRTGAKASRAAPEPSSLLLLGCGLAGLGLFGAGRFRR